VKQGWLSRTLPKGQARREIEAAAALVPPPAAPTQPLPPQPDAPGPKGGMLDFLDGLKKKKKSNGKPPEEKKQDEKTPQPPAAEAGRRVQMIFASSALAAGSKPAILRAGEVRLPRISRRTNAVDAKKPAAAKSEKAEKARRAPPRPRPVRIG